VLVKDGVASGLPGCVDSFVNSGNGGFSAIGCVAFT
jgi:hypothetical protein